MTVLAHPRRSLTEFLPILLLILLPCLLLWRVAFLGDVLLPADLLSDVAPWRNPSATLHVPWVPLQWDGIAEFYPWRHFAATTLRHGFLPLWNPHQFCGTPFVANSQSAVFYPLNLLFALMPTARAFGVSAILHLILSGLFMYGFLRSRAIGYGRSAAALGGVAWQISAWQVSWLALPTFLCVSAWLPLALWLTDRVAARPTAVRAAALGLCLGMMLLGGHVQIAFYCLLLVIAYAIFRAAQLFRTDARSAARFVGLGIGALALSVGLALPQLLPTVELSHMSHRAGGTPTWAGYQTYVSLALPAANLITLFLPKFFGSPTQGNYWGIGTNGGAGAYMENACYIGILSLLLAIIGIIALWRTSAHIKFFAGAALVAMLLALGTPLDAVFFFGIPGFAASGSPGRILVLWTFCAAVLAAGGVHALFQSAANSDKTVMRSLAAFGVLLIAAVATTVIWIRGNAPSDTLATNLSAEADIWRLPVGILLGGVAAYALWRRGTLAMRGLGSALTLLVAADLLAVNLGFNHTVNRSAVYPVTPAISYLRQHSSGQRIMPINRSWSLTDAPKAVLPPNSATVYGLLDTQGYDSLFTRQYIEWATKLDGGSSAPPENGNMVFTYNAGAQMAEEAAAKYVVTLGPLAGAKPSLSLKFHDGETYIYEDSAAQPRIRSASGSAITHIEEDSPTRLRIVAPVDARSVIVADQWYPGWRASVNGMRAQIEASPSIFRTVAWQPQPDGTTHGDVTIAMRYAPESFCVGLYALCVALGIVAGLAAAGARRRTDN